MLSLDDVRTIGRDAAREVAGGGVEVVDVRSGVDWSNDPAYFLSFRVTNAGVDDDARLFLGISRHVHDRLREHGDERWPYIDIKPVA